MYYAMRTRQRVSLFACYLPADDFVPVGPRIWGRIFFTYIKCTSRVSKKFIILEY